MVKLYGATPVHPLGDVYIIHDPNAEVWRRVIADFYQKNSARERSFSEMHFRQMGYKKTQVYVIMKRVNAVCLSSEGKVKEFFRSIKDNIQITAIEGP